MLLPAELRWHVQLTTPASPQATAIKVERTELILGVVTELILGGCAVLCVGGAWGGDKLRSGPQVRGLDECRREALLSLQISYGTSNRPWHPSACLSSSLHGLFTEIVLPSQGNALQHLALLTCPLAFGTSQT
ncbi:hypothetical protein SRHO_G00316280 [Serrasalmus rhombeus]